MEQLTLDLRLDAPARFENFIPGANAELLDCLRRLAAAPSSEAVYIWGLSRSGRSHLLRATCAACDDAGRHSTYCAAAAASGDLPLPATGLLAVDDVDSLSTAGQAALFRACNAAPASATALLLSGNEPPLRLALREDLRTRIGGALVFEVKALSDDDKKETLMSYAKRRGFDFEDDLIRYLLHHARRDLPSLLAVLEALDHISLQRKRTVTLPLLREVLAGIKRA